MNTKVKLILFGVVICMTTLSFMGYKVATGLIDEQIARSREIMETKQVIAVPISDPDLVINRMHHMANSLIISDTFQEQLEMDKYSVKTLITMVDNMEVSIEKSIIVPIAKRWEQGDFISVDYDHNIICDLLGEEAGIAVGINRIAIKNAIANMK